MTTNGNATMTTNGNATMTTNRISGPTASVLAALLAAIAAATPLRAQQADTVALDELVVTATRVAVPRAAVPAAVTVLTGEALRERGVTHALDALRLTPSLHVIQSGSYGATTSLFLRGGESDYVQVLVDGVPLNEPGGRADLANLSADEIERIEIVRGPASVLYGSDAVTGVIQIFTRAGAGRPTVRAGIRGGGYGTLGYDAGVSGQAGALGYNVAASHLTSDGVYEFNNEYRNTSAAANLAFWPDAWTEAKLSVRYADGVFHYPTDGAGNPVDRNAFAFEERLALGLELGRALSDRVRIGLLLTGSGLTRGDDNAADEPGQGSSYLETEVLRRGADARIDVRPTAAATFTAGATIERQEEESVSRWDDPNPDFSSRSEYAHRRMNRGYYAQALLEPAAGLAFTLGARLDDNERFGTFESYRAGAAWTHGATRVRAAFGTAFKEPQIAETYGSGYVVGNPALEPEQSRSWEAGLERSFLDGRLALGATYFDQRFRDMIQYRTQPPGSTEPNYFNVAEAKAAGLELEATVRPAAPITASIGFTRLETEVLDAGFQAGPNAEFVEGERLLRRPTHAVNATVEYRAPRGAAHLVVRYTGDRDDLDFSDDMNVRRVTLDAHTVVDLGGEFRILPADGRRPALIGTVRIDNAFDTEYQEVLGFRTRGRTLFLGARMELGL